MENNNSNKIENNNNIIENNNNNIIENKSQKGTPNTMDEQNSN